jgi:hypothetical protein
LAFESDKGGGWQLAAGFWRLAVFDDYFAFLIMKARISKYQEVTNSNKICKTRFDCRVLL